MRRLDADLATAVPTGSQDSDPTGVRRAAHRPAPTLAHVLRIPREVVDAMVAHAKRDHPDEACGVVAGPEGSDRPERFVPMPKSITIKPALSFDKPSRAQWIG